MQDYKKALISYKNADFKTTLEFLEEVDEYSENYDENTIQCLILKLNSLCKLGENEKALKIGFCLLTHCNDNAQIYLKIASISDNDELALMLLQKAYELILKLPENSTKFTFLMQFYMLKSMRLFFLGCKENALKNALKAKNIADNLGLKDSGVFDSLGCALAINNRYEEAIYIFLEGFELYHTRTFALKIHDTILRIPISNELRLGAFAFYEQRFKPNNALLAFENAKRDKNIFKNKKILIKQLQGLGDTIMYLRYLDDFIALGCEVALDVPKTLKKLLKNKFRIANKGFKPDFEIPFCSLPFYLQKAEIPAPFKFDIAKKQDQGLKIGIFWKTTAHNSQNQELINTGVERSFKLEHLLECIDKKADIFSFQIDANEVEKKLLKKHGVTDLSLKIKDFAATLKELENINLLICCDTAIAHLASGAGVDVIVLLPNNFDWRWGRFDNPQSPWYPQITCLASEKKDDFSLAFKKLKKHLENLY